MRYTMMILVAMILVGCGRTNQPIVPVTDAKQTEGSTPTKPVDPKTLPVCPYGGPYLNCRLG